MNEKEYKELKEMVIEMNNTTLFNLFEILVDEINYRKIKIEIKDTKNDTGSI